VVGSRRRSSARPHHTVEAINEGWTPPSFPWLVAFTFGLLHGLGFAGALAEVGRDPGAAHPPRADAARHPRRISRRRRRWPLYTFGATTVAATARNANI
jgi:hypothetical protein